MKKLIFLLSFIMILMFAVSSCGTNGKPPIVTTPYDTSEPPTSQSTTTGQSTAAPVTDTPAPAETVTYTGRISSPDDIDMSDIKIFVCEYEFGNMVFPGPISTILYRYKYDPNRDLSEYEDSVKYIMTISPDKDGSFRFEAPKDKKIALKFDFDSFPEQYGIRRTNNSPLNDNFLLEYGSSTDMSNLSLERAVRASLNYRNLWQGDCFTFYAELYSDSGKIYGNAVVSEGRFDDDFIEKMIEGGTVYYRAKITCGELVVDTYHELRTEYFSIYWEWRVDYLYYNNYITQDRYDEIVRTKEPSKLSPLM